MGKTRQIAVLLAVLILVSSLVETGAFAAADSAIPDPIPGRGLMVEHTSTLGPLLMGLQAKTSGNPTLHEVAKCFDAVVAYVSSSDDTAGITSPSGEVPVATGDTLGFPGPLGYAAELTIVVWGDVLGNGVLSLSQLTAMAAAFVGTQPLEGPCAVAADINGSGELSLTDLTIEARLLMDGTEELPPGCPPMSAVAQAAYLLNPREEGEILVQDGQVYGPLASTVLNALIDLHAKLTDPNAPTEGLLGDPAHFNPLLVDTLETCKVELVSDGVKRYSFDVRRLLKLLEGVLGCDVKELLRTGVEAMGEAAFWEGDSIGIVSLAYGDSVVAYNGIGRYPSSTNVYQFASRLPDSIMEDDMELMACMLYTAHIQPDTDAPFGFLVLRCRFDGETDD